MPDQIDLALSLSFSYLEKADLWSRIIIAVLVADTIRMMVGKIRRGVERILVSQGFILLMSSYDLALLALV